MPSSNNNISGLTGKTFHSCNCKIGVSVIDVKLLQLNKPLFYCIRNIYCLFLLQISKLLGPRGYFSTISEFSESLISQFNGCHKNLAKWIDV